MPQVALVHEVLRIHLARRRELRQLRVLRDLLLPRWHEVSWDCHRGHLSPPYCVAKISGSPAAADAALTHAAEQKTCDAVGCPYTSAVTNVQPVRSWGSRLFPGQVGLSHEICNTVVSLTGIGGLLIEFVEGLLEADDDAY